MQENIWKDWLHRRHITEATIEEFSLSWGSSPLGQAIIIPIHDTEGNFSFNKYRRNPLSDEKPKYMYDKGSKSTLYGWWKAKEHSKILITEGELDALVAWSANIPAVSSTSGSMTFLEEWATLMKDKEVILCFDNDSAGGEGMVKVLSLIPHAKIMFLPDRPGVKDISDYVQNGGDLKTLIGTARPFQNMQDVINDRAERLSIWLSTHFHDAFIKKYEEKPKHRRKTDTSDFVNNKVLRAKEYPIDNLLDFKAHNALCLWHNDHNPSMHYYSDTNKVYCFVCGMSADAIDVYMKLHNCDFKTAVEFLSK